LIYVYGKLDKDMTATENQRIFLVWPFRSSWLWNSRTVNIIYWRKGSHFTWISWRRHAWSMYESSPKGI